MPCPTSAKLLLVIACFFQISSCISESSLNPTSSNDNPQTYGDMSVKRDWNKNLHIWGKRGWNNLHGGWGLKRNVPTWQDQDFATDKRAWKNLQSGWGKRFIPDDEYNVEQLTALVGPNDNIQFSDYGNNDDVEINDDDKRDWGQFHGGWGKRSKWDKFRGSWGKREPAWSNLKGIWGKRSFSDVQ